MIRLLTFSTLYPNAITPHHGIFVETRLRQLIGSGAVESRVVAPVPWFPSRHPRFGEYARFAAIPKNESRHGIDVQHPRYLLIPKIGMSAAPVTLARTGLSAARRLLAEGYDFDVIDAHYFYPDGVAATIVGRLLRKPVVITARGTDINLIPRYTLPRWMIQNAAKSCAGIVTVCAALKEELVALGAESAKITVLRNGVDLRLFYPEVKAEARAAVGMSRFSLASVGHLIERKGHHLVIEALSQLPEVELFIAGSGPEETRLRALAVAAGVAERVHFVGNLSQERLRTLYSGADALVLASSREGWPNVLLESMACGTPVVAQDVWGVPEVVAAPEAGVLVRERTPQAIAEGVRQLRSQPSTAAATRCYAERFSWESTTNGQIELFSRLRHAMPTREAPLNA